ISGATAGDLFFQKSFIKKCEEALLLFVKETEALDLVSFIGFPLKAGAKLYDAVAAVCRGEILGVSTRATSDRCFSRFGEAEYIKFGGGNLLVGENIIYSTGEAKMFVEVGADAASALTPSSFAAASGANIILGAMAYPEYITLGEREERRALAVSDSLIAPYAVCCASASESGSDGVYSGRRLIAEEGSFIAKAPLFSDEILYGVVDIERSLAIRSRREDFDSLCRGFAVVDFDLTEEACDPAPPSRFPFIPDTAQKREAAAELALDIQAKGLAGRIERARAKCCVIGVSGGLDSTLAVLVCERAMAMLARDKKDVIAITMPCFGTSERTKSNALALAEELGLSVKEIDIKAAVNQHFKDIGQSEDNYDVVYENAQARERTQILMDIANKEGGLVVGTGDLSELALGFATYNGDQMSMYSVNGSVPKTLMREIIRCSAKAAYKSGKESLAKVLLDVIETPVSPELLPTEDGKENAQYTETIVGPYELHDFFIYYTVKYGFTKEKIKRLALLAFGEKYTEEQIEECLGKMRSRLMTQQFKRSCMPDGPLVTEISFSPRGSFMMPSDAVWSAISEDK
ncbi:MAG: NAD(+) synthase, partial [Clostridia bacterium]|nr:NAD(+) synthase [Clostridia bacterium]